MKRDGEFFGERELELVQVSRRLREALAVEDALTGGDVDYFVEADSYALRALPAHLDRKIRDARLPAVYLRICGDTHRFAPAQIEALARELETIVVDAAFDTALPTGIRRSPSTV